MSLLPSSTDASPSEDAGPRVVGVDSEDADEVLAALSSGTARELLAELHDDPAPPSELADGVDTSLQNVQYHLQKLESAGAVEVVDTAYSAKGREMDVYAPADQPLVVFAGDQEEQSMLRTALGRLLGAVGLLGVASLVVQRLYGGGILPGLPTGGGDGGEAGGAGADGGDGAQAGDGGTGAGGGGGDGGSISAADAGEATPEPAGTATPQATPSGGDGGGMSAADAAEATPTPRATPETAADAVDTATAVGREAAGVPEIAPGLLFFAGGLFALAVVAVVLYAR